MTLTFIVRLLVVVNVIQPGLRPNTSLFPLHLFQFHRLKLSVKLWHGRLFLCCCSWSSRRKSFGLCCGHSRWEAGWRSCSESRRQVRRWGHMSHLQFIHFPRFIKWFIYYLCVIDRYRHPCEQCQCHQSDRNSGDAHEEGGSNAGNQSERNIPDVRLGSITASNMWTVRKEQLITRTFTHYSVNKCLRFRSKMVIPHLLKSRSPHILNLSPPLNLNPIWFKNHTGNHGNQ